MAAIVRWHGLARCADVLARKIGHWVVAASAAIVAGCSTPPPQPPPAAPAPRPPTVITQPAPPVIVPKPTEVAAAPRAVSAARSAHDYRADAAKHLYQLNPPRIFKGRMPPMLYAIGVLDVELDRQGQVVKTHWSRAPRHAPEVMAEIEKTVRTAAPYPVPTHLGKVVYTDVWLWHKNGQFQLDTLTEGQD